MARVRLSLSHRFVEDSPTCLHRLLLALPSNWVTSFMRRIVFVFSFLEVFCFCLCCCFSSSCFLLLDCRFCLGPDGPDEAQQFAPHSGDDLALILACRRQPHVALVQSVLSLPGDLFDFFRNRLLSFAQRWPDAWSKPVTPGRFDGDSSQMGIASLGDAPPLQPLAAGVLAGNCAAIPHELPSTFKA